MEPEVVVRACNPRITEGWQKDLEFKASQGCLGKMLPQKNIHAKNKDIEIQVFLTALLYC